MRYEKQHLSFEQQADRLLSRGLVADREELIQRLRNVGYYRLSAYAHPYRLRTETGEVSDDFVPGTGLGKIWLHYRFDRDLRRYFLDAIERIEVALRCLLAYYHTENHTPFDYADDKYFPHWRGYRQQLERVAVVRTESGEAVPTGIEYVDHFFAKYGSHHDVLPLWMAVGMTEFGFMCYFYRHSDKKIRQKIASEWGIPVKTIASWLPALKDVRNDCAHHARVWNNRYHRNRPSLPSPSEDKLWYYTYSEPLGKWVKPQGSPTPRVTFVAEDSAACFLFICRRWLRAVAPTSRWHERMTEFLQQAEAQGVNLRKMGLPPHWEEHPLWK